MNVVGACTSTAYALKSAPMYLSRAAVRKKRLHVHVDLTPLDTYLPLIRRQAGAFGIRPPSDTIPLPIKKAKFCQRLEFRLGARIPRAQIETRPPHKRQNSLPGSHVFCCPLPRGALSSRRVVSLL